MLVHGEAGTGKTRWIRDEAAAAGATLFRWNARVDRSLREGREILHQQVRSKDRLFVWIEGADDLTQEAQAFLRRILETASPNVTCVLEVRDLWKLAPPILSRCTLVTMRAEQSYRRLKNMAMVKGFGLVEAAAPVDIDSLDWRSLPRLRKEGRDPQEYVAALLEKEGLASPVIQNCLRAIGAGSSPWIQLAHVLLGAST